HRWYGCACCCLAVCSTEWCDGCAYSCIRDLHSDCSMHCHICALAHVYGHCWHCHNLCDWYWAGSFSSCDYDFLVDCYRCDFRVHCVCLFSYCVDYSELCSFPTRRSSDLHRWYGCACCCLAVCSTEWCDGCAYSCIRDLHSDC